MLKRKLEEIQFKKQSGGAHGFTATAFLLYLFNTGDSCAHLRIKNQTRVGSNGQIRNGICFTCKKPV